MSVYHLCFQQFGPIIDVEIIFNERGSKVLIYTHAVFLEKKLLYSWVSYSGRRQMRLLIAITLRYNQLSLQRVVRCAGIWLRNIRKQRRRRAGTRENERNRRRGTQNRGMPTFLPLFCCDFTFNYVLMGFCESSYSAWLSRSPMFMFCVFIVCVSRI